jgi:F420-0:gamma-glutamyl ligase
VTIHAEIIPFLNNNRILNILSSIPTEAEVDVESTHVIKPSNEEIDTATKEMKFSEFKSATVGVCTICQEEFEDDDVILEIKGCGHVFKKDCLIKWFSTSACCPLCRHDIRNTT